MLCSKISMLLFLVSSLSFAQGKEFPHLRGLYLGQKPPGEIPEVFAPGIVSSRQPEHGCITFSPNLKEVFWSVSSERFEDGKVCFMRFDGEKWSSPKTAPFSGEYRDLNPTLSADGMRLYFFTRRPIVYGGDSLYSIWYVDREDDGWSDPKSLNMEINSGTADGGQSISKFGNLFFWSARIGSKGGCDIYRSTFINGDFGTPERMGDEINSDHLESCTYIAPDESYLIFDSNRPGGYGSWDLYISFKDQNGAWNEAINMGGEINSASSDWFASISPDGKYLFFVSGRSGNEDIYWVDAGIIYKLRRSRG